ncbi:cupredoxin domain-containing protein [Mycolicibacterium rhodesiae]|uniref:Metal-binding protein n=1 Tax=Mycolicibacterium rhodesiae TaxID=36814 RepID=A0A1X0IPT6_MYCRH|nr:cupredoxin domain-containing protein [Mycolicibacterium rhodesiae]MCV7347548.1 cupredoxin domain-containing protein [Mycolicibacterium rhodesiae]ORB50279.1 metal-binding protein [Mycolicibacterium rhodesiae]
MGRIAMLVSSSLLAAAMLSGCGGGGTQASPQSVAPLTPLPVSASASPAAGSEIVISNMSYTVPPSVKPGQQLTIVNDDSANHTVTADANNLFDVRISGGGGKETLTAPTTPGTYPFHCKYHANMQGVLTVA